MRYPDNQLDEFKKLIEDKILAREQTLALLKEQCSEKNSNGTDDTAPRFRGLNDGAKTISKEVYFMEVYRIEKNIRDLKNALVRIGNKTYGICRVTGKLIPKERLVLAPHATLSIEGKNRIEHEQHKHAR